MVNGDLPSKSWSGKIYKYLVLKAELVKLILALQIIRFTSCYSTPPGSWSGMTCWLLTNLKKDLENKTKNYSIL